MDYPQVFCRLPTQDGFTLIEQIMVLAIIAVLVTVAAPPLRQTMLRQELRSMQGEYMAALNHARGRAIMHGIPTLLCPTADGASCSDSSIWDHGWMVVHDGDHDSQPDGEPLSIGMTHGKNVRVRSSSGRTQVRFRSDGTALGSNITLLFCVPAHPEHALSVVVANSGRARSAKGTADQIAACAGLG